VGRPDSYCRTYSFENANQGLLVVVASFVKLYFEIVDVILCILSTI